MVSSKISFTLPSKTSGKRKARAWEDRESNPFGKPKAKPWEDKESEEDEESAEEEVESVNEFDPAKPMKKVNRVEEEENSCGYEAVTRPWRLGLGANPAPSVDKLKKMMMMIRAQKRCKNVSVFPLPLPVSWLTSQIRVIVISKDVEGGKFYLKKGRVIDVVGVDPTTFDLLMDGSGALLQGVKQDAVKAALPHIGGLVMIIGGEQKGVVGKFLQKVSDKGIGLLCREDTYEILYSPLNYLVEFVGDPEQLAGY